MVKESTMKIWKGFSGQIEISDWCIIIVIIAMTIWIIIERLWLRTQL